MLTHSTRRWLAGLGVAGALVAASASPAVAVEEAPIKLGLYFGDTTVATNSAGKVDSTTVYSNAPVVLRDVTVRYDFRDVADKITVAAETPSDLLHDP